MLTIWLNVGRFDRRMAFPDVHNTFNRAVYKTINKYSFFFLMASLRVGMQYIASLNARFLQDLRNFF